MKNETWISIVGSAEKLVTLGILLVCTNLIAAPEDRSAGLLLRDMQNELILGSEFSQAVATCLDEEMSYAWVLSSNGPREVSKRTLTRLQRARETCVTAHDETDPLRATTRAVSMVFASNLDARRRRDASKVEIRACMESSLDAVGFRGCLVGNSLVKNEDPFWSRWMRLFELYSSNRALSGALK